MFKQRAISAVILVIIAAITLYFGGALTCLVMCAVSLIGVMELLRIYGLNKKELGYAAYGATVFYYALLYFDLHQFILPLIAVYMLVILAIYVLTYPNYKDKEIMAAFFAFVYVGVMLSYVYLIRDMKHGLILVLLIFVSSWGNDTCAYLVGRAIGKHKMSPILSPKKSIEGLIGGIVGAGILGVVFGLIYNHFMQVAHSVWIFALIGAVCALPAVIGDLAASAIKRNNDIKDYGKLIPGHGGILDRFDSIIFTAPIMYYLILYLL
ncbi:phosphatidate cytidylyltransferase [Clostridium sp. OM05-9]|jgi:phosphatidate cytidylyltransferase|uniref:phosphatidate cytidylyltransferase n=1 Tax=unclassified Clostridium TaxID=2614128 RepID=UPI000E4F51BA|nr:MULTISPECIES: phosphatidate cytidylyltransferase [unclassified Clostridium]RHS55649.1 phosphatidate cytidylyltransferase [Clostridium sp. AM46-21]RHV12662.1 phosphatidate cytidylyltransferase [Clostridium sp. OM05-9]